MDDEEPRYRLTTGLQLLELWAATAGQVERNLVYQTLFAIADGSVFWRHTVLRDASDPGEFYILVREDLVVKIDLSAPGRFGIRYVGARSGAHGIEKAIDAV